MITLDKLDKGSDSPSKQINARSSHVDGAITDPDAVGQLVENCDVLTIETEHVNTEVLEDLATGTVPGLGRTED